MAIQISVSVIRDRYAAPRINAANDLSGVIVQNQYPVAVVKPYQSQYISNVSVAGSGASFRYWDPAAGNDLVVVTNTASAVTALILA